MLAIRAGRSLVMCHFVSSLSEGEGLARLRIGLRKIGLRLERKQAHDAGGEGDKGTCTTLDAGEPLRH